MPTQSLSQRSPANSATESYRRKIVRPEDLEVLNAGTDEVLTLVTCYPFYFVGSAPERFIVRAERAF